MLNPQPSTRPLQLLVCPCLPRRQAHVERPDRCTLEQLKVRSTALELILKPFLDTWDFTSIARKSRTGICSLHSKVQGCQKKAMADFTSSLCLPSWAPAFFSAVSAGASGNSPSQLDLWSFRDFFRSCRCHIAWDAWCCISGVFLLHFLRMAWYLHVINHANAEASIHTRNTSIITQKGWWWCFSHEEGSSTSASARGSNYILIILRALVIS